jgi:glutamate formiminotransferase
MKHHLTIMAYRGSYTVTIAVALAILAGAAVSGARAQKVGADVSVTIDPVAIGKAIAEAAKANTNKQGCIHNMFETLRFETGV